MGTVDSGRGDSYPFDLEETVLERVHFARADLGEIQFEKVYLEKTDSRVNLGKVALEKVLAYMECQVEQQVFEVLTELQEWIEHHMPKVKTKQVVAQ